MGYGKNLQEALKRSGMTVYRAGQLAGIPSTTIYSAIKRDSALRLDLALRLSDVLGINVSGINPYQGEEKLLKDPSGQRCIQVNSQEYHYIKNHILPILSLFDDSEKMQEEMILAKFYMLNDSGRMIVHTVLSAMLKTHMDKARRNRIRNRMGRKINETGNSTLGMEGGQRGNE